MIPVESLFEVHLTVADLNRAIAFYRDIVGLQLAHVIAARQAAFLWVGGAGKAMLGLWTAGSGPERVTLHTAFRANLADVVAAPRALHHACAALPSGTVLRPAGRGSGALRRWSV